MSRPKKAFRERDKEATKRKLITAVGQIIKTIGYTGLGVNKVAKEAGVSKSLIYKYFTDLNGLIETYMKERDYWLILTTRFKELFANRGERSEADIMGSIMEEEVNFMYAEKEMQHLIYWQISESSDFLRSISNARESMAGDIFKMTDTHFEDTDVNFRAVCALLLGGNYYAILHAVTNGSTVCELDMNKDADRQEIIRTIKQIISWAYKVADEYRLKNKIAISSL
jgi:AcrR family transcriptional regulator